MSGPRSTFEDILSSNIKTQQKCLDKLVEDINENKERTIYNFLGDSGSEDFLWSLVNLLSSDDIRISSNAAYVLGSFAETELGSQRILSITQGKKSATIILDLTNMLKSDDSECVMNAAGTLGTLAETNEGRCWMLAQPCIDETVSTVTNLLVYENNWVASNAALVLARLTISEDGCHKVLEHRNSSFILTRLIHSLGNDSAGRGMNAAFAIGRLLDMAPGKKRLLHVPETEKMISTLCRMLSKGDLGSAKNACFAISCLATDNDGNQRIFTNNSFNEVLSRLVLLLLNDEDVEAAWFSAMTLRTMSSHHRGVLRLRESESVLNALTKTLNKPSNSKELNEEIEKTLNQLKRLEAPSPPTVQASGPNSFIVSWGAVTTYGGLEVVHKLFEGTKLVYKGKDTQTEVHNLLPNRSYTFKLKTSTIGDESPFSNAVTTATEEGLPSAPCCLRVLGSTPSQIRVSWNPPEHANGILRGYFVFLGEKQIDVTNETSFIFGRLQPSTSYTIHVCASTAKGVGDRASIVALTDELGAHAPGKPSVTVIGRNEVHVTWNPPVVPLGRFFRFELAANKEVIYSGTDRSFYATNLIPDKDYSFTVSAITSEGKCESEPTKKRTAKDKTLNEPGRHASKTHSFKAKEFQLEKSKTQATINRPKQKYKKSTSVRPNSCISKMSGKTLKVNSPSPTQKDGSWANETPTTTSTDTTDSNTKPSPPFTSTNSVDINGASLKVDIKPVAPTGGKGNASMFLQKSYTEYPLHLRMTDKSSTNQAKLLIEPVSWNDVFPLFDDGIVNHVVKKPPSIKPKSKVPSKVEPLETEKSFISLVSNNKSHRNGRSFTLKSEKRTERNGNFVTNVQPEMNIKRNKPSFKGRRRPIRRPRSPVSSDSSEESPVRPEPLLKESVQKLEPLTLADVVAKSHVVTTHAPDQLIHLEEPKQIVARLKSSSKGYWSDYDAYPTAKKKTNGLTPIVYKTFKGAHRPSKSYRQESSPVTDSWLSDLPAGCDKNKYKFIPTQLRTQPIHLPKPGRLGTRLESLTQLHMRQDSSKRYFKPSIHDGNEPIFQRSFDGLLPKKTRTYILKDSKSTTNQERSSSPFGNNLIQESSRNSPHQRALMSHGNAV